MAVEVQEMPDFSDPPDYVDDITEAEVLENSNLVRPTRLYYEECCVLIYGIPIVGPERIEKLKTVLAKLFSFVHPPVSTFIPTDDDGKTKGYCFIEYDTPAQTNAAAKVLDGSALDKNHTFSAYVLSAMRDLKEPEANWTPPAKNSYVDAGDLWWWTQNPKCMDQFAIQVETGPGNVNLGVFWNAKGQDPYIVSEDANRLNWSEFIFKWSPSGTYLASFHSQGVALWGGEKFVKIQKIQHPGVSYVEFSPNETYIVTYAQDDYGRFDNTLRVFDVFTGEQKKSFQPSGPTGSGRICDWPFLKWSHDEKYFAFNRAKGDSVNVYNAETFTLENQIELAGLITFEWNPTKNVIAYYCEERHEANAPAEVGLIEYPSKQRIRAQRIFSVSSAMLYWQKSGEYLAAQTERYSSRKIKDNEVKLSGPTSHLEIFDCTAKEVSVQTIQLPEPFINFGFEPKGDKFCVLVGSGNKVTPLIYKIDSGKPAPILVSKLDSGVQLSVVKWAPQGGWLVVYSENSPAGQAHFIDASGTEVSRTRIVEHPSMNYGEWDPTGRYFITASAGHGRYDTGYRIHTFMGREIYKKSLEGLTRFKWRPRPKIVIPDQKVKEIKRNLKNLSRKFEEEDRKEQDKASKELIEKRRAFMSEFNSLRQKAKERNDAERDLRLKLRNGVDTSFVETDLVEEEVTIPLTTTVKPLTEETPAEATTEE
jgi:translation initiation factor 3 subunit B